MNSTKSGRLLHLINYLRKPLLSGPYHTHFQFSYFNIKTYTFTSFGLKYSKMYVNLLIIIALGLSAGIADGIKKENLVLILTKANFEEAIKDKNVLVVFYSPQCGYCKAFEPEFNKAADILAKENSEFVLGKVDGTVEKDLANQYNIKGYPTLKFFQNGKVSDYTSKRNADDIVAWLKKQTKFNLYQFVMNKVLIFFYRNA